MRTILDARLVDPAGREPGLWVDVREQRRSLLFDLGEIERLSPRALLRSSHAFVTHAHMDHFSGFDHWLALGSGRMSSMTLWGGPGFVDRVEHKLAAYAWNVVHRYPAPLVIEAHALEEDGSRRQSTFDSRRGFVREDAGEGADAAKPSSDVLVEAALFRVRARIVDHEMPVLAFALEEKAQVRVASDRIAKMGLATGPWLRELKTAVLEGSSDDAMLSVAWRDGAGEHVRNFAIGELRHLVLDTVPGRRFGYVTDLRHTQANLEQLDALLPEVDTLFIECVFAEKDRELAARRNHLTARQAGGIARRLRARQLVPFHLSPRYQGEEEAVRAQAIAAWQGAAPIDRPAG